MIVDVEEKEKCKVEVWWNGREVKVGKRLHIVLETGYESNKYEKGREGLKDCILNVSNEKNKEVSKNEINKDKIKSVMNDDNDEVAVNRKDLKKEEEIVLRNDYRKEVERKIKDLIIDQETYSSKDEWNWKIYDQMNVDDVKDECKNIRNKRKSDEINEMERIKQESIKNNLNNETKNIEGKTLGLNKFKEVKSNVNIDRNVIEGKLKDLNEAQTRNGVNKFINIDSKDLMKDKLEYILKNERKQQIVNERSILDIIEQNRNIKTKDQQKEEKLENVNCKRSNYCKWFQRQNNSFIYICYYNVVEIKEGLLNSIEIQSLGLDDWCSTKKVLVDKITYKVSTPLSEIEETMNGDLITIKLVFNDQFKKNDISLGISNMMVYCNLVFKEKRYNIYTFLMRKSYKSSPEYVIYSDNFLYRFKGRIQRHPNVHISYEIECNNIYFKFKQDDLGIRTILLSSDFNHLNTTVINLKYKLQNEVVTFESKIGKNGSLICKLEIDDYVFYVYKKQVNST